MTTQSEILLKEWNAKVIKQVAREYHLDSCRSMQLEERYDGEIYSRIHRVNGNTLVLEERNKGEFYPKVYLIEQDFSDLDTLLQEKSLNS